MGWLTDPVEWWITPFTDNPFLRDALWAALHAEFSEPELVELGYWIGFTFGGQRWLKTLSTAQGEFAASLAARK